MPRSFFVSRDLSRGALNPYGFRVDGSGLRQRFQGFSEELTLFLATHVDPAWLTWKTTLLNCLAIGDGMSAKHVYVFIHAYALYVHSDVCMKFRTVVPGA